jgi:3'(2'), 5'-bisphosphate nucleotidase
MLHPDQRLELAVEVVGQAALVARAVQQNLQRIAQLTKDDRSPVTVADFAVQAIVALSLQQHEHALIVGEESGDALRETANQSLREAVVEAVRMVLPDAADSDILAAIDSGNHDGSAETYWTLDPVDGTKGFLRGQQYAVSLAWIDRGHVVLGVLGCPNLPINQSLPLDDADRHGSLYVASAGCGSWERRLDDPTASPTRLRRLLMADGDPLRTCESVEAAHSSHDNASRVLSALGRPVEPVRLDSQCKYALVARSQADAYLRLPTGKNYVEKVWDHAAGMIVAAESGAMVSDILGRPLDVTHGRRLEANRGIVCAAPEVHGDLIAAIGALGLS